ncbi:DUF1800 family protein [Chromatocurvus halotolerans]|nr:DUF1800 family protein [Chromatocurvus halotolerans]
MPNALALEAASAAHDGIDDSDRHNGDRARASLKQCGSQIILFFVLSMLSALGPAPSLAQDFIEDVQKMYIAYYGRPGDPGGLTFWSSKIREANGDLTLIAENFGNSKEFTDRFGSLSDSELVDNIYLQLLGRSADPEGLNFYVGKLQSNEPGWSLASIALRIIDGVPRGSADDSLIDNRLEFAGTFVRAVSDGLLTYEGDEQASALSSILSTVTMDPDSLTNAISSIYNDGDSDNVVDVYDLCPSTSTGIGVDSTGCPAVALDAFRFLSQSTYGVRPGDIDALLRNGTGQLAYDRWLKEQAKLPPTLSLKLVIDEIRRQGVASATAEVHGIRTDVWMQIAMTAEDQLRQRMAFALSQIFVISDQGAPSKYPLMVADFYDTLIAHALGNYRDLFEAVTLHPAMGLYLSMMGNRKSLPGTTLRPDENYARESMQLFSIGLSLLNQDGTRVEDATGAEIPTYGQAEVSSFARTFTGWNWACWWYATEGSCNFEEVSGENYDGADQNGGTSNQVKPMAHYENYHDSDEKQLLTYSGVTPIGGVIPAGTDGPRALGMALDNLFYHPNVPPFISRQLIQRLVTSNPSPGYVQRVADMFKDDGTGVRGNLFAVARAILLDPEARPQPGAEKAGKLKEPLLKVLQTWRAFNGRTANGRFTTQAFCCPGAGDPRSVLGQSPNQSPSVFNFYSPFYSPGGEIAQQGLVSPEMQLALESLLGQQLSYYAVQSIWRSRPNSSDELLPDDKFHSGAGDLLHLDFSPYIDMAGEPDALMNALSETLFGDSDQLSPQLRDGIRRLMDAYGPGPSPDADSEQVEIWQQRRVREAVFLILVSPEFAVQ